MDKIIKELYSNYGDHVNKYRMFPLSLDGLRPVERRVLLVAYQVAREKFQKATKVDGTTLANYHPHGSVFGTMCRLVHNGFLDSQGSWGSNVGISPAPPAAPRYVECKLSQLTQKLCFTLIDHVPWVEAEADKSLQEPVFLPAMFPLCLLGNEPVQGIGFGYRTFIPCYRLRDLYDRLMYLLGEKKEKPVIKPVSDCKVVAPTSELEKLLTTGKATIELEGKIEVDNAHHKVVLRSWPNKSFESLISKFRTEINAQEIGWIDLSTDETKIVFEVLKQRNRESTFKSFVEKLKKAIQGRISYEVIVVDFASNKLVEVGVDDLLLASFTNYSEITKVMLEAQKKKVQSMITEYKMLQEIRPHLHKYLNITDVDTVASKLSQDTSIPVETVKDMLSRYRISRLFSVSLDIKELDERLAEIDNSLSNLKQYVLKEYKELAEFSATL